MIPIPAPALEAMARAAYESTRTPSFPAWDDVTESYRADVRKSITAALTAGEAVGCRVVWLNAERVA